MSEIHEECGVAAIYHLPNQPASRLSPPEGPEEVSRLIPLMLLNIQNRGQLSAGMTSYSVNRSQLIDTHKDLGNVGEAFRMSHGEKHRSLMRRYAGRAAIGHVRYATCGRDDRSYAQPFERHHIKKHKWFSFAFNGQLANYDELRDELLHNEDNYLAHKTDTEIFMHLISGTLNGDRQPPLVEVCRQMARRFDGAYSLVFLDALGNMIVMRDPLGFKPLCYALEGPLFAAASESVALLNLGFKPESIIPVEPGEAIIIQDGNIRFERFADSPFHARCFFEWIYFANAASTLDNRSVYLTRKALGKALAEQEDLEIDERDTIVVPVPDTSKAAADSMAFELRIPSVEGLIRNRYSGRSFIEGRDNRQAKIRSKFTPLIEVLRDKRVLLVEDSIVRGTTLKVLIDLIRRLGEPREIHVRVACPPIIAPCFYGIDMSSYSELLVPRYLGTRHEISREIEDQIAADLGVDSVRYLRVEAISRAIGFPTDELCQACITGTYPTEAGTKRARERRQKWLSGEHDGRPLEPSLSTEIDDEELL